MKSDGLQLVLATEGDFLGYFKLRCEPKNIYWSGFDSAPEKQGFKAYFLKELEKANRDFYLLKMNSEVVGYLYLDYFSEKETVEYSYGISEHCAGQGLAKKMIELSEKCCRQGFNNKEAWIAENNIPSIKTVQALGFSCSDDVEERSFKQEPKPVKFYRFSK